MSLNNLEESIDKFRSELVEYLKECYTFASNEEAQDVKDILKRLSAFSARARWIRSSFIRSPQQKAIRFRIDEIDPFLQEVDIQFKIWSRIGSLEQLEWEQSKG